MGVHNMHIYRYLKLILYSFLLSTIVENLFAQGRKGFRQWAKALWFYSLAIEAWQLSVYNTLSVLSLFF